MQIGLLGYGTVGKGFYALSEEQPSLTVKTLLTRRPRGLDCRETADFADIEAPGPRLPGDGRFC